MGAKKPLLATTRQSRGVLRKMKTRLVSNTKSELPTKPKATPAKSEKQVRKTDNKESQQAKQSVTQRSASATPSSAKVVKKESTQTSSLSSSSTSGQDRKASLASPGGQQSTVAPKPSLIASSTPKKVQQQVADAQQPKPDEDKAKAINKMLKSLDIKISGFKNIIPDEQKSVECKASISEIVKTKSRAAAAKVGTVSSTKSTRKGGAGSQEGGKKPSGAGGKPAEKTKTGERRDDDGKDETSAVCLKTKDMKNPQSTADGKVKEKSEVDELKSQSTRRGEDRDTESTSRVTHFLVANAFQEHVNKKFEGAGEIQSGRDEGATSKASNLPPTQPAKIGTGQAKPRSNDGNKTNALLGGSNRSRKKEQVKKDNNQQVDKATAKQSKKGKKTPPDKSATEIDAKSIPQKPDSVLTNAGDNSMLHSENVSSSACDEERVDKNIASSEDNEGKSSKIDKLNEVLPVKNTATKKSSSKSRNNTRVQKKTGAMSKTTKTGEISSIEKDEKEEKRPPIEVTAQSESKELKNSKEDEQKKIAAAAARKYKSKNKGACNEGLSPLNLTVTDEGTGGKIPLKEAQNTVKAPNEPEKSVSTKTALGDKASTNKTSSLEPVKGLQEKRSEAKAANETPSQKCSLTSGPLPGDANPRENENSAPNSEQEDTPLEDAGLATSLPQTVSSKSNSPLLSQQSKLLTVRERLQKKYIQNRATTTGFRSFKLTRQAKPIKIAMKVKPQKSVSKSKKDTTDEEDKIEKKEKDVYDFKTESESDDNIKMNLLGESSILSKICLEKDFSDEDDRPLQLTKIQLKEEQEEKAAKLLFDEQEKLANEKLNELKVKTEKKTQTPKKGAEKKSVTLVVHQEGKKQTRQPKKPTTSKRKERTGSSTSSTSNTDTESDESSSSDSRLRKMSFGPKRHRMASLNALAKVQCLYENESKTAHELGLSKTAQIPRIRLIQSGSSSDEEKEIDKKSLDLKNIKKEEPEVENKRELRNAPGLRGIGKHWDFNDVSSFESGHESDVTFKGRLDSKPKNKKRKVPKPKVTSSAKDKEKEKTEPKAKKVVSKPPQKKKPRSPPPPRHSSSDSSDDDDNSKSSDEHLQGNKKRKREKTDDIASDLKQMLVHKRMAGLNASAIVAATYEVERHLDRNLNSDCSSFESFPEDEKPIIVNPPKKAKDIKKDKSEDAKCNSKDAKESGGKDSSRPTSSSVVIVQDTDVTITGVYVNSSTGSSQEAYCKMQYRVQSSVTEERVLRPSSIDPPKSYTPLGALSSMRPPGAAVPPEGQQHTSPPQQPSGQQAGVQPPPSANIYQSPTISQELSQPSGHVYAPVHHHPGSPMGPTHQHQSEQQQPPPPLHHHHHPQQQPKYPPHLARHHHHQQPHQPTPLAQSRCESPVRYQSGPYQSVQPTIPPSLTMPGSGSSAFCAPMQQPHHDMSDGCHIAVAPPKENSYDYYNFKGWHSILLLAIVDFRYCFTYINVGMPGRVRDSYVFETSNIYKLHKTNTIFKNNEKTFGTVNVPVLLIGDSGFSLSNILMKPFPFADNMNEKHKYFNKKLSSARRVVENAFGHVKARFRKLGKGLEVEMNNATLIIKACCVLHNFFNMHNDHINKKWVEEMQRLEAHQRREQPHQRNVTLSVEGQNIQNAIMEHIWNERQSSGYYQPAGPLISPHVLPPVPPSNAALVSTKQVPSPLDSDPDQLQQPPPSTSAAESSDSEVLITGGDLTTFRYPTQQQQAQSQQLSALSSQQQSQQGSPYPRSMHQMHYPPAYPPSYYSPYPGDAMCYSPPYQPYFPTKVYQSAPAYRRYPSYYQPGHPPPSELYEPAPPSSAAPPPPSGSQLVPSGPTAPQHMDHYPGPPGFYAGYSPGGGQCYSRGMQPPYMEYPPPCPCPMQSCPKNVLTGPLIGSNSSGSSSSNTNSSSSASNTLSTSNSSSNNSNNSISNSSNTANSSLSNLSQPLKASKGPGQQVQHSIKTHGHMMGGMDATAQLSNGSILGKPHLHRHHVHQCKMELLEPMKPELKKEINDTLISDDNTKSSQYEEMAVPPTPPSSYTVNDKLIEPEITVSPARGSTGLPTVPDQTDKAASTPTIINSPQPPMAATIPRESGETGVNSSNLAPTIGRKARLGKTMAREMMYGAHALQHHHPQHPQIFSHTHIHHHIPSHNPQPEMIPMSTQIVDANASIMQSDYSKIKTEEIKKEEEDIVVILDDEKKIKTEPEVVEVFDESSTKFDKSDSASNEPPVNLETSGAEDEDIPRHGSAKRMKILELNKAQCKKSPPNGYKSLIKQADPKPYLCLSRKSDKKDRYAKITSRGGVRKRKLMLTEQQKKRLIMRKRKLMLEKKKQKAERAARNKSTVSSTMSTVAFGASNSLKDADAEGQEPPSTVRPAQAAMDQSSHQPADLLPATPLEHTIDCVARGYFSEPEIRSSAGRKAKKTKSSEVRSKSETKKSPEQQLTSRRSVESVTTVTTSPTKVSSGQHRHKPIWRDSANDEPQTEHPRTDSKKRRREKSSSKTKSNKSSAKRAKSSNADCLSAEISEDLTQSSVEGSTGVTINNNVLETNNNQLPDDVAEEGKTPQAAEHPLPSDEMFQPVGQRQPSKRTRSRSKFGNRRRQRARHPANNQIVDPVVIPRKLNVVPRWNNGWSWEGQPFQGKVFLNSDDPLVVRTCYPAMRHEEGDVVRPRDCVLLRAGTKKNELPYVAKVAHLWENPEDGEMMMSLLWYYRPEHTEQGRQSNDNSDEVFASRHRDHNSVACIEDKCYVLTFSEYCRYRRIVRAAEEEIDEEVSVVPSLSNSYHFRQVPVSTNPEQVLFCQRVYDFRLKRLMKTSSNN